MPSHMGIQGDEKADKAAKAALNQRVSIVNIPFKDLCPKIRQRVTNPSKIYGTNANITNCMIFTEMLVIDILEVG